MFLAWVLKENQKIYIDNMTLILISIFAQGLIVGFLRENSNYYILSDLFAIFAALFTYSMSSLIKINTQLLSKYLKKMVGYILFFSGFVIGLDYLIAYYFEGQSYLSYGDYLLLIPFSYYLFYRNTGRLFLTITMIFFGAKVGAMVAALSIVFTYKLILKANKISAGVLMIYVMFTLLFGAFFMYTLKDYQPGNETVFSSVLSKIQSYNYFHYNKEYEDLDAFGAGRMDEVNSSLDLFKKLDGFPFVFGAGSGFVYDSLRKGDGEIVHNVHLSALNIIEKHGIPLTIIFYWSWLALLYRSYKIATQVSHVENQKLIGVMCCFCIGVFAFSFTAFSVFGVLTMWFFLGFINSIRRHELIQ